MAQLLTRADLAVLEDGSGDVGDLARCPECGDIAVLAGPREHDTGHQPITCAANCGWSN